jgi:hypothetical protein
VLGLHKVCFLKGGWTPASDNITCEHGVLCALDLSLLILPPPSDLRPAFLRCRTREFSRRIAEELVVNELVEKVGVP